MLKQRFFKLLLIFADVELCVCGKELNSDIPSAHGYPQQVVMMMIMMMIIDYDGGNFDHCDNG